MSLFLTSTWDWIEPCSPALRCQGIYLKLIFLWYPLDPSICIGLNSCTGCLPVPWVIVCFTKQIQSYFLIFTKAFLYVWCFVLKGGFWLSGVKQQHKWWLRLAPLHMLSGCFIWLLSFNFPYSSFSPSYFYSFSPCFISKVSLIF